jgi:hypothetical protein
MFLSGVIKVVPPTDLTGHLRLVGNLALPLAGWTFVSPTAMPVVGIFKSLPIALRALHSIILPRIDFIITLPT